MNVNELYQWQYRVQEAASKLSVLSLHGLEITLQVDRQGKIFTDFKPTVERGQTIISYNSLLSDLSGIMFEQVLKEIDSLRRLLTARLFYASARIQNDIHDLDFNGTISFWRNGNCWLQPLLHDSNWKCSSKLLFVEGFDEGNGIIDAFMCNTYLWQMSEDYQSCFITEFWPDFSLNAMERVQYSNNPPPFVDLEVEDDSRESLKVQGGLWTLH